VGAHDVVEPVDDVADGIDQRCRTRRVVVGQPAAMQCLDPDGQDLVDGLPPDANRVAVDLDADRVELALDPPTDGVVAAGQVPRPVCVQALDAGAGAADAAARSRSVVIVGELRIAFGRIAVVGGGEFVGIDLGLGAVDAAGRLEPSSRSGALRSTTGSPASSRTTIS
jgi:hypothetical protein